MKKDLEEFLINAEDINREKLAEVLAPYLVGIDKEKGTIILNTKSFQRLSSLNKTICFLLAVKAAFLLEKRESDETSWKEICEMTGMPDGTVRPALTRLKEAGIISGDSGKCKILNHALHVINLDEKLNTRGSEGQGFEKKKIASKRTGSDNNHVPNEIDQSLFQPYIELLSLPGQYLKKSLLILKLAKSAGEDGLTPKDIEIIFTDFIRQPISNKNISYALGKAAAYTMRSKKGNGYVYKLTPRGEKIADEFSKEAREN